MMAQNKAKVSERALMARINRKLTKEGQILKKCKTNSRWYSDLGDFYIVSAGLNSVAAMHCDLLKLAKDFSVLNTWEEVTA